MILLSSGESRVVYCLIEEMIRIPGDALSIPVSAGPEDFVVWEKLPKHFPLRIQGGFQERPRWSQPSHRDATRGSEPLPE